MNIFSLLSNRPEENNLDVQFCIEAERQIFAAQVEEEIKSNSRLRSMVLLELR